MRVFIHSRDEIGATRVAQAYAAGEAQDPRPYGFQAAEGRGYDVEFSDGPVRSSRLQAWGMDHLGFDLVHAWRNLRAIRRADVIWTVLEWEWLAVSLLQRVGLAPRRPIVANSVWLVDRWSRWGRKRRWPYKRLMAGNLHLTLHSRPALGEAERLIPDRRFNYLPFGISSSAFPLRAPKLWSASGRPIRVYAIGNDGTRDWPTMMRAFGDDARFEVRITCQWLGRVVDAEDYGNLSTPSGDLIDDQLKAYDWADVVIMPMVPNVFSGITVVCEAVARGVPVVSSETGGVPGYFNASEVLYVPAQDPDALRAAVVSSSPEDWNARAAAAAARFAREDYTAAGMVRRYEEITRRLAPGVMPEATPA